MASRVWKPDLQANVLNNYKLSGLVKLRIASICALVNNGGGATACAFVISIKCQGVLVYLVRSDQIAAGVVAQVNFGVGCVHRNSVVAAGGVTQLEEPLPDILFDGRTGEIDVSVSFQLDGGDAGTAVTLYSVIADKTWSVQEMRNNVGT